MCFRQWICLGLVSLFFGAAFSTYAQDADKKLILFGWDMQSPEQLEQNISEHQHLPFDGLTVRATNNCYAFYNQDLNDVAIDERVETMSRIEWGRFTNNLMYLVAAAHGHWFDDEAWSEDGHIIRNVRAIARMGEAGGCEGILFNPEFIYWGEPAGAWNYRKQPNYDQHSIDEYRAMARKRGVQFIDAIEAEMPDPAFLTLYWAAYGMEKLAYDTDPKLINEIVGGEEYGLLHDFMLGILEGADPGTKIIDGNEPSYYANETEDFLAANEFTHHTMLNTIIPENLRDKYREQVYIGHAIYSDHHSNTRDGHSFATYMTPRERAKGMERIVYLSMKHSDEYVWMFTEKPRYLENIRAEPMMFEAIERGKRKVAAGEPLGFDFRPIEERASDAYRRAQSGDIDPLSANIGRASSSPQLDGRLGDEIWQNATELGPFQSFMTATHPFESSAKTYMAYDDTNLYIAFRTEIVNREKLDVSEIDRDDEQRGGGDLVEVGIATDDEASAYRHIRLGYDNRRWDALTPASVWPNEISGHDSSWTGDYETAVYVDPDLTFWSAEIVIPWADLDRQPPRPGDTIKGNLIVRTDRLASHGNPEFASWSLMRRNRLIEAASLGTWTFK